MRIIPRARFATSDRVYPARILTVDEEGNLRLHDGVTPGGTVVGSTSGAVASPTFSPNGGEVSEGQALTLTSGTVGASIRYTTNGDNPSSTVGTLYDPNNKPTITVPVTIKAIAYKSGMTDSSIVSRSFTIADEYDDVYWGVSTETSLDATEIQALVASKNAPVAGNYSFSPGSPEKYLYLAIRSTSSMPRTSDGFVTGGLPMIGDLAGSGQGYDQTVNGWPYMNVVFPAGTWRLFRTLYTQGSDFIITVNT